MDYDGREIKWYWLLLFILYSGAVIYLLFQGNPYLYSHHELRAAMSRGEATSSLLTIPAQSPPTAKAAAPTYFERFNFQRSAVDPLGSPRSKNYEEYKTFPVEHGVEGFAVENISNDGTGFYLSGKSPWVVSIGLEGELRWKFRAAEIGDDKAMAKVLLDESAAYVVHPGGEVVALNKVDGSLKWLTNIDKGLIAQPFLWKDLIVIPVKGTTTSEWAIIRRADGKVREKSPKLDIKPNFVVSQGPGSETLIVCADNKVMGIDTKEWKIDWTQTLTDPVQGPAVVVENHAFLATLGSKLIRLDANKKGKIDWEADLEKAPANAPSYIPIANRLSVQLISGEIVAVDAKLGKLLWTYNSLNKSPLTDTWSVRLSAKHIEEYKMDWLHKGWTVWSACSNRHFCIYTPNKGQLVQSVQLSGNPLTLPLQADKAWIFFGKKKDGEYVISHLLEATEIKKLKAEAEKQAAESTQ